MITEEHVGLLGEFSLNLLRDDHFNTLVQLYQFGKVEEMLGTQPEATTAREQVYAQIQGLNSFIAMLKNIADRHDELANPQPVDPDAPVDDPSVHDIFNEE